MNLTSVKNRKYGLLMLCMSVMPVTAFAQKDVIMSFGNKGAIHFNTKTNTYSILYNNKSISSGIGASFEANGQKIAATDYAKPVSTSKKIIDELGEGIQYTFTYKAKGKPVLVEVFNVYKTHDFFTTQIKIESEDSEISTNYLSPVNSGKVNFDKPSNLHTVFVPYDNDAFISYESKKLDTITQNNSAEVGYVFNNQSRNGFVIGSLEHTVWKSGVQTRNDNGQISLSAWAGYTEKSVTRDEIPHGKLKGKTVISPKYFVGYFADWRTGLEEYGKANRLTEKPFVFNWDKPTPVGWNSWGVLMDKITPENTKAVTEFFADQIPYFRVGGTAFIDLDSFWDSFDWGNKSGELVKLKAFADYCTEKGLQPGVYWAPFTDWGWKDGPARKIEGTQYTFGDIWTKAGNGYFDFDGARAIDPTHPATLKRVDDMTAKLKACGFKMIKIDFLGHAAAEATSYYDKSVTTGMQAYRVGMEHLVKQLDGKMLIYAAISPNMATARYAHMRRIACDAWKTIEHTQYTLNSVNYGWWQTYAYNYIDADHVVFADESEGENRARLISAVITGTLITGDDYSKQGNWTNRAKQWLQNKELLNIVAEGKAFKPVEGDTGKKTSEAFIKPVGKNYYLAVFNYTANPKAVSLPFERLNITKGNYKITDILSGESFTALDIVNLSLGAKDGHLYKIEKI